MSGQEDRIERIEQMVRVLCGHLGVRDLEPLAEGGGGTAAADGGPRYAGVVSRFEHGWGFIDCEAMNRNYFVHYSDVEGNGLRSLEAGEAVSFEIAPGRDGRPKAVRVRRDLAARGPARPRRIEAIPRPVSVHRNGDHGFPQDADDDGELLEVEGRAAP